MAEFLAAVLEAVMQCVVKTWAESDQRLRRRVGLAAGSVLLLLVAGGLGLWWWFRTGR
jgi:hypothetical protein